MPIKFASNITTRVSTVNLERQLLHALLSDKLNLQRTIGRHRSDFFTNQSRLFIYDCIVTTFNEKRCTLLREQFDFEIQKRFDSQKDKARIDDFVSEFELIRGTTLTEDIDSILQNLEEVQLANATESIIREAYTKLESGEYIDAVDVLKRKSIDLGSVQKENRIYNLHKDNEDWFAEVRRRKEHPEIYAGIPTGFKEFDEKTGGLFPAELTVVFGLSGKGKSTLMKAIACNIRKTGRNVLHCGNEENEFQMRSKYMSADSGAEYSNFKKGKYSDEEYISLKQYSDSEKNAKGGIYIYEFPQQTDATWIERAYRQLEMQGIHIDVIVVDYLDLMKPCEKAYSENDEGGKVTSDLKQVAINCNVPLITATQAGIQSEKQEKKDKPFLNQSDVFGTKRKVHSANTLIGIVNQTATAQAQELSPEQRRMHHLVLCVPKNRDGAVFTFRQKFDSWTGRFYEDDGTSDDEQTLKAIANQALRMIDDTMLPGQMVSEITVDGIAEKRKSDVDKGMEKLKEEMAHVENDPLLSGAPTEEPSVQEEPPQQETEDPLLAGAPTEEPKHDEEPVEESSVSADDFLAGAPSKQPVQEYPKMEISISTYPEQKMELDMPLTPFDDVPSFDDPIVDESPAEEQKPEEQKSEEPPQRTSDSIPHKRSFADILAEKKANREKI